MKNAYNNKRLYEKLDEQIKSMNKFCRIRHLRQFFHTHIHTPQTHTNTKKMNMWFKAKKKPKKLTYLNSHVTAISEIFWIKVVKVQQIDEYLC